MSVFGASKYDLYKEVNGFLLPEGESKTENRELGDGKTISKAGKEVMVKTVLHAIPTCTMSVFLLPHYVCSDIKSYFSKCWRRSSNKRNGIHRKKWSSLCLHKSKGGLGFKNLGDFKVAMLGKQGWRLMTNENSLTGRVFKARYYLRGNF